MLSRVWERAAASQWRLHDQLLPNKKNKGREAKWEICKGQRNRDLDASLEDWCEVLAVKTGKELGAFNEEVPADGIWMIGEDFSLIGYQELKKHVDVNFLNSLKPFMYSMNSTENNFFSK